MTLHDWLMTPGHTIGRWTCVQGKWFAGTIEREIIMIFISEKKQSFIQVELDSASLGWEQRQPFPFDPGMMDHPADDVAAWFTERADETWKLCREQAAAYRANDNKEAVDGQQGSD